MGRQWIRASVLVILLLSLFSVARVEGLRYVDPTNQLNDEIAQKNMRELTMVDAMLDYDKAGANPRHEQGNGKPGGGTNP
ncbi:hypothetical protein Vadar_026814 [Vaccinium darrowii]|uniref:Uncharacterized protein n=1 Tax=Vaccinium darrowii TaxID=229202 RepID=A0ACB7XK95_9ERIC|nr:hypothetical protein Vadar_026814 [Vaccinium darrowii]